MATASTLDRLYTLRELQEAGYGDRVTLTRRIQAGELPAVRVGNRYKVYESDLRHLAEPANEAAAAQTSAKSATAGAFDDLASMLAQIASSWPCLSDERKAELNRLLTA